MAHMANKQTESPPTRNGLGALRGSDGNTSQDKYRTRLSQAYVSLISDLAWIRLPRTAPVSAYTRPGPGRSRSPYPIQELPHLKLQHDKRKLSTDRARVRSPSALVFCEMSIKRRLWSRLRSGLRSNFFEFASLLECVHYTCAEATCFGAVIMLQSSNGLGPLTLEDP